MKFTSTKYTVLRFGIVTALKHPTVILFSSQQVTTLCFSSQGFLFIATAFVLAATLWISVPLFSSPSGEADLHFETWLKPMLFPCRTSHTRLDPHVHSFSYSYLYVGVPVGWRSHVGSFLSMENVHCWSRRKSWFSVEAKDYLSRGSHPEGLAGKLRDYLKAQGIDLERYEQAYLVTAPRFLGYSFNPVSFWYLYDDNKRLSAMILEVNNTFDERRLYLLIRDTIPDDDGTVLGKAPSFSQTWAKDFHVSPFNDRHGSYFLRAIDPFTSAETARIDCNITLKSVDERPKLVARVFSTASPVLPSSLSHTQTLRFLFAWWWVGLLTDLRILREARKLWAKGLQVFYRPEVLVSSIGRRAALEEEILEKRFRAWLKKTVGSFHKGICVHYVAALNSEFTESFGSNRGDVNSNLALRLRILSPAFYRALVYSADVADAFEPAYFNAAFSTKLIFVSDDTILQELLLHSRLSTSNRSQAASSWLLLYLIQGFLPAGVAKQTTAPLDYQVAALKIWLSDKISFGSLTILASYKELMWLVWLYFCLGVIEKLLGLLYADGSL